MYMDTDLDRRGSLGEGEYIGTVPNTLIPVLPPDCNTTKPRG